MKQIEKQIEKKLNNLSFDDKINFINRLREFLHLKSPFKNEPVDFV